MAEESGVDIPVLTPEGAAVLLRYLSITAAAADRAQKNLQGADVPMVPQANVHQAIYRTLSRVARDIRADVSGGRSIRAQLVDCSPALQRNSPEIDAAFRL